MKATLENLQPFIVNILKFLKENNVNIKPIPKVIVRKDIENSNNPLGTTAYYEATTNSIVLYTEGRHIKDILRSFTHEMIHHDQLSRLGELNTNTQNVNKSKFLEKIEADAYLRGNMLFRKWENAYKNTK